MCKFWVLATCQVHAQIWQFWKLACISETAARRAKMSSISTPCGRKRVYVQLLGLWPLAKFHAQIWQFWKLFRISETAARRAKISSTSTPSGRKRVYVQLLELWPIAKFHAQIWQFWKLFRISETVYFSKFISLTLTSLLFVLPGVSISWNGQRCRSPKICSGKWKSETRPSRWELATPPTGQTTDYPSQ